MFKKNTGKGYEDLITYVYQQLSDYSGKDIKVEKNIKLLGKKGSEYQVDVYYEFDMNGIKHKVIIECKDHKRKVERVLIEAFRSRLEDIGGCIGIFASRNGFQQGALKYGKDNDIELISGGELPLLSKVLTKKLEVVLPDESIIAEPFWTIMEAKNGNVTGTYMCVSDRTVGLFVSRKIAEEVCLKTGGVVRGVSQKHLRVLIKYSELNMTNLCVFFIDKYEGHIMEAKVIKDYFIA